MKGNKLYFLIIIIAVFSYIFYYEWERQREVRVKISQLVYFSSLQMEEYRSLLNLNIYGIKNISRYKGFKSISTENLSLRKCNILENLIPEEYSRWDREGMLIVGESDSFFLENLGRKIKIKKFLNQYYFSKDQIYMHKALFSGCYKFTDEFYFENIKNHIQTSGQEFDFKDFLIKNSTYIDRKSTVRSAYYFMIIITFCINFIIARFFTKGDNFLALVISISFSIPQIFFLSSMLFSYM
ncbi:MAG: hypothetical protein MH321_12145 [Leptospiraceae bacterium]|nr:hypothetical protein [Leptospiraceae bacterium]